MLRKILLAFGVLSTMTLGSLYAGSGNNAEDFSGPYLGGHLGYVTGHFTMSPCCLGPSGDFGSFMGGVQAGYNWQCGGWVYGCEGDFTGMCAEAMGTAPAKWQERYTLTLRARAGYAFDFVLPYVTAGLAFTDKKATIASGRSASKFKAGPTAGAGVECYVGEWLDKLWFLRVQYLYVFVDRSIEMVPGLPTSTATSGGSHNHLIDVGANIHF